MPFHVPTIEAIAAAFESGIVLVGDEAKALKNALVRFVGPHSSDFEQGFVAGYRSHEEMCKRSQPPDQSTEESKQ